MQAPLLQPTQRWWDDECSEPPVVDAEPSAPPTAVARIDLTAAPGDSDSSADAVPFLDAVADPDDGPARVSSSRVPWRALAAVGVCVGLAVAGAGGMVAYRMYRTTRLASLRESCVTAVDAQSAAWKGLEGSLSEARDLLETVDADDVTDVSTIADLSDLVDGAPSAPDAEVCAVDAETGLTAAVSRAESQTQAYDAYAEKLAEAVDGVVASRDGKVLDDARKALDEVIDKGGNLLESSKGMVKDGKTRDALSDALDRARDLDSSDDPEELDEARTRIKDAMDDVTASVKAKEDEEARKQKEAEEAAAAAAQQAQSQSQQSYTPSYGQSYTPSYGGGSSYAPSTGQSYAPSQSYTPSYGGGSGSSGGSVSGGSGSSGSSSSGNLGWLDHINDGGSACTSDGRCPIG